MLLSQSVRDNHKEKLNDRLVGISRLLLSFGSLAWNVNLDIISKVRVYGVLEIFNLRSVVKGHDVTIVNEDIKSVLLRERVELILQVLSVLDVLLETEDCPLLEVDGLAHDLSENVSVIEALASRLESSW